MGPIVYNVVVAEPSLGERETEIQTAVQATLDRVNDLMSTYLPDSDVSRFNKSQSTDWQPVDPETAYVVRRAIEIGQQTSGAFDITVAPAVNAWQFGPKKTESFSPPSEADLIELREKVGYHFIESRLEPPAIRKTNPDVCIDLSAIAKGYAVDQVAKTLSGFGFSNYMVEVGGEVFAQGERVGGGKWRIGIESPKEQVREYEKIAELSQQAMATSGDYRIFRMIDGKRYSHTIDPTTCAPVEHSLATACVIAPDCLTADAFATAVTVLGAEQGAALCRQHSLELFTVERGGESENELLESVSEAFPLLNPSAPVRETKPGGPIDLADFHRRSDRVFAGHPGNGSGGDLCQQARSRLMWGTFQHDQ